MRPDWYAGRGWHATDGWHAEDEQEEADGEGRGGEAENPLLKQFLKTRTILLTGEINKELAERVVRQLLLMEQEGNDPIKVFIDSPGGDADAGFAILDMMRFVRPPIKMIGTNQAPTPVCDNLGPYSQLLPAASTCRCKCPSLPARNPGIH